MSGSKNISAAAITAKTMTPDSRELEIIYHQRFAGRQEYRNRVWQVLIRDVFGEFVRPEDTVLDLGCGYGEFINQVGCATRYGMDLNPASSRLLASGVRFLQQDCSAAWPLPERSLDVVFTSNFFEHLPDKKTLAATVDQIHRCLRPGGKLIALGPNIKFIPGAYWDFWDHSLPLTELSLCEGLRHRGFDIIRCHPRFLPYTMVNAPRYPLFLLRLYLAMPWVWRLFGKQFLVVSVRRENGNKAADP
jgi:SAM-dependent methyltransferase